MNINNSLECKTLKKLKSKIKVKLAEKDMQQTFLADKIGVTKQTMNGWVKGRVAPPLKTALEIAEILNCKVDDLWELYDDQPEE